MFSRKRASSGVRLPRVFSCSMASRSIDCCAMVNSGLSRFWPVVGSGASPRWTITLEPSDRTSALKSSMGPFVSSAILSPEVERELLQPVPALHEEDGLAALARLAERFLQIFQRLHFRAVDRPHQ